MTKIHAYASEPHFLEHLRAIHKHLPDGLRGMAGGDITVDEADVVMVASFKDAWAFHGLPERLIYIEHGAGQTYIPMEGAHPHAERYSGGPLPDNVIGCIAPRQEVADRWDRPSVAVGCPVVDDYELFGEEGVIAITFHWRATRVCPEATNALDHYAQALGRMVVKWRREGLEILGHQHPRFPQAAHLWKHLKVRQADVDEVRRRASLLIADNTSLAYEMLHIGRNVISLNAPWFRRDVEHGLRFWSHVPGRMIDEPEELDALDLTDIGNLKGGWNEEVPEFVYGRALSDGAAGLRAASWIVSTI